MEHNTSLSCDVLCQQRQHCISLVTRGST